MKLKHLLILLIISTTIISCKNNKTDTTNEPVEKEIQTTENKETSKKDNNNLSEVPLKKMMVGLQGEWKEPKYPFRRAIFKNETVKFVEEGVVEPPHFQAFQLLHNCPSLSQTTSNDIYISVPERETCEKVTIAGDSLTLQGVKSEYTIIYKKIKIIY